MFPLGLLDSPQGRRLDREVVSLRALLESTPYQRSTSPLTLALGQTRQGEPHVIDLAAMPHLLVAGAAGAGKSVALHAMLASILFRASPEHVRLVLIDLAHREFDVYEGIPHLLTPIVVDPMQASNALSWAVGEMERRYGTLAACGVRSIQQYHRATQGSPLPFVVVVVDELAGVMRVDPHGVEQSITRLAQMARAVGIHLILATERLTVDVITGLLKANLPARIAFRVASKVDSRTILDGTGAEALLGTGDMLFLPPASSSPVRLQGPFVPEEKRGNIAGFLRAQGTPVFDESITAATQKQHVGRPDVDDDLYVEAALFIITTGEASISRLQRRLRIGFSRAARLLDRMREDGLI